MNTTLLKELSLEVLKQLDEYSKVRIITSASWSVHDTRKVITLLIAELDKNEDYISERVLRAVMDVGAISVKNFEETPLGESIDRLFHELYVGIPDFKNLHRLGNDFGKCNPI